MERDLRYKSRVELIEIIAAQKKRELELQQQLEEVRQQLADRTVKISKAGSIAEAALVLNGVFEAAQAAADSYLQSLQAANAEIEQRMAETEAECERRRKEADRYYEEKWRQPMN